MSHRLHRALLGASSLGTGVKLVSSLGLQNGAVLTIPTGSKYLWDLTTPIDLQFLEIGGDFRISDAVDTVMRTNTVIGQPGGSWRSGTTNTPSGARFRHQMIGPQKPGTVKGLTHNATTNAPTGNDGFENDDHGIYRGFLHMDGFDYVVNHAVPNITKTKLAGHHYKGENSLQFIDTVDWKAGDLILVYPTGFNGAVERFRLTADTASNGGIAHLDGVLGYDRYGLMQYMLDDGTISNTPGAFTLAGMRASPDVPDRLDQRCKVFNVTRLYSFEGDTDSLWTEHLFGGQRMKMGLNGLFLERGAQYLFCGQAALQGRYPFHDHHTAYNPDGTTKTNVVSGRSDGYYYPGQRLSRDIVVLDSANRIHSAHGCRGAIFRNIIADNFRGNGFFLEDHSEIGNVWQGCHGSTSLRPRPGEALKVFDTNQVSAWWITNKGNDFTSEFVNGVEWRNSGVACEIGVNIPSVFLEVGGSKCTGLSTNVPIVPAYFAPTANWSGFEAHSNNFGKFHSSGVGDEAGNEAAIYSERFELSTIAKFGNVGTGYSIPSLFVGDVLSKNRFTNYVNKVAHPIYKGWTNADSGGIDGACFTGVTHAGEGTDILFIQRSLNQMEPTESTFVQPAIQQAVVSYHNSLVFRRCSVFGFKVTGVPQITQSNERGRGQLSMNAFVGSWDTYLSADVFWARNYSDNKFNSPAPHIYINPNANYQNLPPFAQFSNGFDDSGSHGNGLGTAWWDYRGDLFGAGADKFVLLDHPSLTYGSTGLVPVNSQDGNYIGMTATSTRQMTVDLVGYDNSAIDTDGVSVADKYHSITMQRVDQTTLDDAQGAVFSTVNHPLAGNDSGQSITFSLNTNGWFRFYQTGAPDKKLSAFMGVNVSSTVNDPATFVGVGVPWPNDSPWVRYAFGLSGAIPSVASKADLLASTSTAYWRDTANQIVWTKLSFVGYAVGSYNDTYDEHGVLFHGSYNYTMEALRT